MNSIPLNEPWSLAKSPTVFCGLVRAADLAAVVAGGVIAYAIRHGDIDMSANYIIAVAFAVLIAVPIFQAGRIYLFSLLEEPWEQLRRLLPLWGGVMLVLLAGMVFTKTSSSFSRLWLLYWLASGALCLGLLRALIALKMRAWRRDGLLTRRVAVYGAGEVGRWLLQEVAQKGDGTVDIVGLYDDRGARVADTLREQNLKLSGNVNDLMSYMRENPVDSVVVALPWTADRRLRTLIAALQSSPVDVQVCPHNVGFLTRNFPLMRDSEINQLGGLPVFTIISRPLTGWNWVLKWIEDMVVAVPLTLLLLPVMAVIAVAVKLDSPGPVLFKQKRGGFNGRVFTLYKFRTMEWQGNVDDVRQATREDPRVTRVGRFLRRTSLDELPQIFNVLRGEMSVVGPRPHALPHDQHYSKVVAQYFARHRVKPGITGWAQVSGLRGETDTPEKMQQRVDYDLHYIDNWSLLLDLRILLKTVFVGFVHRNAY
ncbi:MAG: undecaprenyl-phosphate glucose phosphotransferase [Rhodospirillales bacterium]|nr:undecaprenyl-phosphate glucose phosphotransferase [Rhodospirillales bacterium]